METKKWAFPGAPEDLVQILRDHSREKEGPFSWISPRGGGRPGLLLESPKKTGSSAFHCKVLAIRYVEPRLGAAMGTVWIISLRISRFGDKALIIAKCRNPDGYGDACHYFFDEMDRLHTELTNYALGPEIQARTPGQVPEYLPPLAPLEEGEAEETPGKVQQAPGDQDLQLDRPLWFPKTQRAVEKWQTAFSIIQATRQEFRELYDGFDTKEPEPSIEDLRDALAEQMGISKPSRRWVVNVKTAGQKGWLL